MRAFVALPLPEHVRAAVAQLAAPLRGLGEVRWTRPEQLHVTLKFLGEIDAAGLCGMQAQLSAGRWPPLALEISGLGCFPARGAVRVVWAGLRGDLAGLRAIAADVATMAEGIGVPRDDRPFQSHVTLGRCRSPRGGEPLRRALAGVACAPGQMFTADAAVLYRSELGAAGSRYTELLRVPLCVTSADRAEP